MELLPDTEIRKLGSGYICQLVQILEQGNQWKDLMFAIPQDYTNTEDINPKYTNEDMRLIEDASIQQRRPCTEILLEEWGTSGKQRPTVEILYTYLKRAELFRAADLIAKLLKEPIPERPKKGPARVIVPSDINIEPKIISESSSNDSLCNRSTVMYEEEHVLRINQPYSNDTCAAIDFLNYSESTSNKLTEDNIRSVQNQKITVEDEAIRRLSYHTLKLVTDNFSTQNELGNGAFGSVYFAKVNEEKLAIKRLNVFCREENILEHFKRELIILSHCNNHENLLPLIAISDDDVPCLIYEFMPNGSLEDRLHCKKPEKKALSWQKRISIACDITEGLKYLHTLDNPILHRDVKTSNILLDSNDIAKIGDFGLVRIKHDLKTSMTTTVQGTNAYMAPEALRGILSTKADIFSFGIVLLELLTGLPAYDENREYGHLMYHVEDIIEDSKEVIKILDEKAGKWDEQIAEELYNVTVKCLALDKKHRIDTIEVANLTRKLKEQIINQSS